MAQHTLDAASAENVEQLLQVLSTLLRRHSQVAQHAFRAGWLVLDVDLTGKPAGKRAAHSVDGGGGSIGSLNFLLERGSAVVGTDYCVRRTQMLAQHVVAWIDEAAQPNRQMGWGASACRDSVRPVQRLAVRSRSANGQWHSAVLLFAGRTAQDLLTLMGQSPRADAATRMQASLHCSDLRGGGIESSFGQDKRGLGLTTRTKKRLEAQRLLMRLPCLTASGARSFLHCRSCGQNLGSMTGWALSVA